MVGAVVPGGLSVTETVVRHQPNGVQAKEPDANHHRHTEECEVVGAAVEPAAGKQQTHSQCNGVAPAQSPTGVLVGGRPGSLLLVLSLAFEHHHGHGEAEGADDEHGDDSDEER